MAIPALQIDELITQLTDFHHSGIHNDLKLRAFRNKAQSLLAQTPGSAYMALGMIATLEYREDEACQQHERALQCGWNAQRAINYATTLQLFYRYDEAFRQARDVMDNDPFNLEAIKVALMNAYFAGRFRLVRQLIAEYRKRVPNPLANEWAEVDAMTRTVLPVIEQAGLTDERIATMQQPAWTLVRAAMMARGKVSVNDFVGNDGQSFLSRTIQLPLAFEEAQALNDQWVAHVAEDEDWPLETFVITFREKEAA